ncbi:MAG TPA: DUF4965 domain-containing protein [Pirellulales bacterium]|nr:DUF4965 domain-containing protein [Pirellulales bacterium]
MPPKVALVRTTLILLASVVVPSLTWAADPLRPPSVPLVACDPYFSIWSPADRLTDAATTHWTGKPHRLSSSITVDGQTFRVMGAEPADLPAMPQKSVTVWPTRTVYQFESDKVALTLTFMTPSLPESIDLLSWPVTYVTYSARSADGNPHRTSVTFEAAAEVAVNESSQKTVWSTPAIEGLSTLSVGSESQTVLGRSGDDLRIDWGYFYLSAPARQKPTWNERQLVLDLGSVDADETSRWLMLAYDDLYSIQYMQENLQSYWRRDGWEASDLLQAAAKEYEGLARRCKAFDEELMADLRRAGGENYASLCALCYRECFAAGKFVADASGQPLQFSKENHSNGCIATSDVFYPMAPQFLLFGPSLAKSFLVPFLNYAASDRWKFPFAPHDLGQYPLANGQVYGGGERSEENQMPVEECGNVVLLIAAIAQMEGNPGFANLYWKQIETWAEYLMEKGFDPANQLCTDDFAGHLAHNVNLSAKAICAIGAYGKLCQMRGESEKGAKALELARTFAGRWMEAADEGDHYRLAFDKKGSWSQKYNLIWDRILDLNLFPPSVAQKELAWYRKMQNEYGLPLDNRATYTKLDWITWTATLTQNRDDFSALLDPLIAFINRTPDRSPLTDWYQTKDARKVGFTARPVVGGVFAQMLYDREVWKKWAARDKTKAAGWAAMPKPPVVTEVVATARSQPSVWFYTLSKPAADWSSATFDPKGWKEGKSGFGTSGTPGAEIGTLWSGPEIWLIRDIDIKDAEIEKLRWLIHHDEDAEIFVNGSLAGRFSGYTVQYETRPLSKDAVTAFRPGKNRIAVHCRQTGGGQYIDVGLATVTKR